jgi:hypothetical protein
MAAAVDTPPGSSVSEIGKRSQPRTNLADTTRSSGFGSLNPG